MLSLDVVIPTKNSMPYLPHHAEGLRPGLDLASEVVDSHSTDDTVEFLHANLKHPGLRFTTHPPGFYTSWNHGIAQIKSRYVFIATAGDTITRKGICKLVEVTDSLACNVVIGKPTFCDIYWQILSTITRRLVERVPVLMQSRLSAAAGCRSLRLHRSNFRPR